MPVGITSPPFRSRCSLEIKRSKTIKSNIQMKDRVKVCLKIPQDVCGWIYRGFNIKQDIVVFEFACIHIVKMINFRSINCVYAGLGSICSIKFCAIFLVPIYCVAESKFEDLH